MKKIPPAPVFDPSSFDPSALSDPKIMAKTEEYNRRYLHWSELVYRVDSEADARLIWNAMKLARRISSVKLDLCGRRISFCMIPHFTEILRYIDHDAMERIETRLSEERMVRRYLTNSLVEESIASSQIEGAATTRKVARQMLLSRRKPRDPYERMIFNNYLTMEEVKQHTSEDLTRELILELHRTITKDTLDDGPDWEGRFRETDDVVVGDPEIEDRIYHRPPDHGSVPGMIDCLCDFANDNGTEYIHPIIKAIILHYMIGFIHPFVDGNGRLARCVFYWYCMKNGYPVFEYTSISSVIKNSQVRYSYAYQYTESDENDLTYFIKFNLDCIHESVDNLVSYMDRKAKEQRSAYPMIENGSELNLTEALVIRDMRREPSPFSIYDVQNRYGIVYETARKYILHLERLGYISMVGRDGKKRLYRVEIDHDPEKP